MRKATFWIAVVVVLGLAGTASASWAYTPTVVLVSEADYVVVGKIVRTEANKELNDRRLELAVVQVAEQLKGDTVAEVKITFDSGAGPIHSAMIVRKVGDEGVWILKKEPGKDYCDTRYPLVFRPLAEKAKVAETVKAVSALSFGEAVKGLAIAAAQFEGSWYVWAKNVGTEQLSVNTYVGHRPVRATAKNTATGEARELNLYAWLAAARLAPPSAASFVALAAAQATLLQRSGFSLPGLVAGDYEVTFTYGNEWDGKVVDVKNAWTGVAKAPTVKTTAAPPPRPAQPRSGS